MNGLHVGVRLARVIDVVRAVAATAAVQTEAAIDIADAQDAPIAGSFSCFEIWYALAGVLGDLFPATKMNSCETAFAVNWRIANCQAVCKFELHRSSIVRIKRAGVNRPS